MQLLQNPVRDYAWGSPTVIPGLLGIEADGSPRAELWLGAHPSSPSVTVGRLGQRRLDDLVGAHPHEMLGPRVHERFGARLPYLLKVLAADRPLSLQVHPSASQAAQGWAAEERSGVPLDAPHRSYKDDQHKPELLLALTRFEALCGFRQPEATAHLMDGLAVPELQHWRDTLQAKPSAEGMRAVFTEMLAGGPDPQGARGRDALVHEVAAACRRRLDAGSPYELEDCTVVGLAASYPDDRGVLVALLLHRVSLAPGQALFLGAGNVHAHLHGTAVELMACSDNVLRGGLTAKHVDIPELLRVVDFTPTDLPYVVPDGDHRSQTWRTTAEEFQLTRVLADGSPVAVQAGGPRIVLCLDGELVVRAGGRHLPLGRGRSAFVPDEDGPLQIDGRGTAVVAAVRQD